MGFVPSSKLLGLRSSMQHCCCVIHKGHIMATKKSEILIEELKAELAATAAERDTLRARIDTGIAAYKTARAEIARLTEVVTNKRVVFVKPQREAAPVVTRFYRGGKLWEKTRVGNVATERLVEESAGAAS